MKLNLRKLVCTGIAVGALAGGLNPAAAEPSGKVVVFGVFKAGPDGKDEGPLTGREIVQTNIVPARVGVRFGLCAEVKGIQPDGPHAVTVSVRHPVYTGADGIETNGYNSPQMMQSEAGTARWCGSHLLKSKYELTPGNWRFEVSYNGVDLFTQEFKLQADTTDPKR